MTARLYNILQKAAGVVCLATAAFSGGMAVMGLIDGQVSLITKSAAVVFAAGTNPTGFWIMEAIYAVGSIFLLALGIFAFRADRPVSRIKS
jgi:hypothetical protein